MANGKENGSDFYAVLGLNKDCTTSELRNAYKKLALEWHPDRCSAPGSSKFVEEAKKKFQTIQQAYSVLSDANKRLMYDVGVYDSDDDENGMSEFLNEMAAMMSQTKPSENGEESFEQFQKLFDEMLQEDMGAFACNSSSVYTSYSRSSTFFNKRHSSEMSFGNSDHSNGYASSCQSIRFGVNHKKRTRKGKAGGGAPTGASHRHRHGARQKVSSDNDICTKSFQSVTALRR